jgi:hypothetical protein
MSGKGARLLFVIYLVAMAVALTFPGIVPFNRVRPMVLGLPFNFVWVASWVALGFFVLTVVDRAISKTEDREPER